MPGLRGYVLRSITGMLCLFAHAQLPEHAREVQVEILAAGENAQARYTAELVSLTLGEHYRSMEPQTGGLWRFRDVPFGEYRLTIFERTGAFVFDQTIVVGTQTSAIIVRPPITQRARPISGTISQAELRHPVNKKALRAINMSRQFFDRGDFMTAEKELQKAIEISPDNALAYRELAAIHLGTGQYERAMSDTARALTIAGANAPDLCDMALALYKLGRFADSIESSRAALRRDHGYIPAHYVLGAALATNKSTMAESVPHLMLAAQTFESAKALLTAVRKALE
jgi:tetratricopeptide (TPR) repeat protein